MPLTIPPELKKITPYIRRAEELDRDKGNPESRLVAYYCRQYAVHTGIALATSADGKGCLGELLGNLEGEKEAMDSFTREESKFLCQKFAQKIFDKADQEDRSGSADRNTARTFYAAASFLEILQQFYQDDDDSEELQEQKKKSVYCKWKSTEILKAIKEGRTPTPGGYGEDTGNDDAEEETTKQEEGVEVDMPSSSGPAPPAVETVQEDSDDQNEEIDEESPDELKLPVEEEEQADDEIEDEGTEVQLGPPPAYPAGIEPVAPPILPPAPPIAPPMDIPKPPLTFNLPSVAPPPAPKPRQVEKPKKTFFSMGAKKKANNKNNKKTSKAEIADATELTRFALAALEDKDVELAAQRLEQALQVLGR